MKGRSLSVAAGLSAIALTALAGVAVASGTGVPHQKLLTARVNGAKCAKTFVNGITDTGTILFAVNCGASQAVIRTRSGATRFYKLPASYAKLDGPANIASNGTLAIDGSMSKSDPTHAYLVSKSGHVTALDDPKANGFSTVIDGVNDKNDAVGYYCTDAKCTLPQAFVYKNGHYLDFKLTRLRVVPQLSEITDSGAIIGTFFQAPHGNARGFIKTGSKVEVIDAPGAPKTKLGLGTLILNGAKNGTVCGAIITSKKTSEGFVRYRGKFHVYDLDPTAAEPNTEVEGCSAHGLIAASTIVGTTEKTFTGKL